MRQKRRGFTLIELLVVIGIIMALIGILVLGFRHVSAVAAHKETIAELHIARGMLTEYENHNGVTFINTIVYPSPATITPIGPLVGDMSSRLFTGLRYPSNSPTIQQTASLMQILEQIPANRNLVQTVQAKRILEPIPGGTAQTMDSGGAILLDGWGDPIILVPAAGLVVNITNPTTNTASAYYVRSSGMIPVPAGGISAIPAPSLSDRPFFASAGQDGDFSIGEDNVYSFQD